MNIKTRISALKKSKLSQNLIVNKVLMENSKIVTVSELTAKAINFLNELESKKSR